MALPIIPQAVTVQNQYHSLFNLDSIATDEKRAQAKELFSSLRNKINAKATRRYLIQIKLTKHFEKLKLLDSEETFSRFDFTGQIEHITTLINELNTINDFIANALSTTEYLEIATDAFDFESDSSTDYIFAVESTLNKFRTKYPDPVNSTAAVTNSTPSPTTSIAENPILEVRAPQISIPQFHPENDYRIWFLSFENIIHKRRDMSDAAKLIHLRSSLNGYAFQLIENLSITDSSYPIALEILASEFLNEEKRRHQFITKILNLSFGQNFAQNSAEMTLPAINHLRNDFHTLRGCLHELANSERDFFQQESAGNLLLSHLILNKIPKRFTQELVNRTNNTYPNLNDILRYFQEILLHFERTTSFYGQNGNAIERSLSPTSNYSSPASSHSSPHQSADLTHNWRQRSPNLKNSNYDSNCKVSLRPNYSHPYDSVNWRNPDKNHFYRSNHGKNVQKNENYNRNYRYNSHNDGKNLKDHEENISHSFHTFTTAANSTSPSKQRIQHYKNRVSYGNKISGNFANKNCVLCSGDHTIGKCLNYKTPVQRIYRLQSLNRCGRCSCLHGGDLTKCPGITNRLKYPCSCSSRSHIRALCMESIRPPPSPCPDGSKQF